MSEVPIVPPFVPPPEPAPEPEPAPPPPPPEPEPAPKWWKMRRANGEVAIVAVRGDRRPKDVGYNEADFTLVVQAERRPDEHEFVDDLGKISIIDPVAKAEKDENNRMARQSPRQRQNEAVRTARLSMVSDLEAEGVINGPMATRLRNRIG